MMFSDVRIQTKVGFEIEDSNEVGERIDKTPAAENDWYVEMIKVNAKLKLYPYHLHLSY